MRFYRLQDNAVFCRMQALIKKTLHDEKHGGMSMEEAAREMEEMLPVLLTFGEEQAVPGNLWQLYLTLLLIQDVNAYTLSCERREGVKGSVYQTVQQDLDEVFALYQYDFAPLSAQIRVPGFSEIEGFVPGAVHSSILSDEVRDNVRKLRDDLAKTEDALAFRACLERFYAQYGIGVFALYKGFRIDRDGGLLPIRETAPASLDDLVGYENVKRKLKENTDAFLEGRPANNVLLYGEAGTGKSTCIKALCNSDFREGLRVIEVFKGQYELLHTVIESVRGRHYRFLLFMDDLSFEEFETEYKFLKAVIEGGLEERPENVLIYATSNRKHLIRESFSDRDGLSVGDKHPGDTVQEKLSLSDRFGLSIYFESPAQEEYHTIVQELADRYGLRIRREELREMATTWELRHGGPSGRVARQFIDDLRGKIG
ncbi:MAG: ATP-binding protein [Lachnospiraceae bacterium]|nr:ATP-binding protein [Lachnospiraceae bacterium]